MYRELTSPLSRANAFARHRTTKTQFSVSSFEFLVILPRLLLVELCLAESFSPALAVPATCGFPAARLESRFSSAHAGKSKPRKSKRQARSMTAPAGRSDCYDVVRLEIQRHPAPMLLLSCGSGVAALIYEIIWFQLLELIVGSSAVSLAVLLATFMGGTCLGSLLLPRLISEHYDPLRVYACIELGIAVLAIAVLLADTTRGQRLHGVERIRPADIRLARNCRRRLVLLPPTVLMGRPCRRSRGLSRQTGTVSHGLVCSTEATSPEPYSGA